MRKSTVSTILIAALGTLASLASVTVPVMFPVVICPRRAEGANERLAINKYSARVMRPHSFAECPYARLLDSIPQQRGAVDILTSCLPISSTNYATETPRCQGKLISEGTLGLPGLYEESVENKDLP